MMYFEQRCFHHTAAPLLCVSSCLRVHSLSPGLHEPDCRFQFLQIWDPLLESDVIRIDELTDSQSCSSFAAGQDARTHVLSVFLYNGLALGSRQVWNPDAGGQPTVLAAVCLLSGG